MAEWLTSVRIRLRALLRRDSLDQDLRDEMAFHLAMREEQLRDAGSSDAGALARRRFGSAPRIHEELRDAWALAPRASAVAQDLRYAMRTLLRHRGFTAVVVLTLAFGIAINTATFSIVNAVLLRPLGFPAPERLVMLEEYLAGFDFGGAPFSPPDFLDVERDQQSFAAIAAYVTRSVELSGGGEPMRVVAARASAALFPVLGVGPRLGRTFTADEDRPGADVAVLSWRLWQSRYRADAAMVGQPILLDRRPYTVVGVMPPGFEFPTRGSRMNSQPADVWVPMAFTDGQRQLRGNEFTHSVVGRLNPDVSIDAARAELEVLASRINERYPLGLRDAQFSIRLSAVPLHEEIAGPMQRPLLLLLAAVGLVLLVTCANVANLVLSRVASRTRELALRAALGSGRGRLLQLLLAEATLISVAGALFGVLASRLILAAVPVAVADTLPAARDIPIDLRVLAFTAAVAAGTALLFALVPLVTLDRRAPGAALQDDASRTTPGVRRHRLQAGLVVSTVMLACVLLVAAGLFVRSFAALMASDGGFERDHVLTAALTLPRAGYSTAASVRRFHAALFTGAGSLPGVRSAALATDLPFERYEFRTMAAEGVPAPDDGPPRTYLSWVHGPYFETLGIRLARGRMFLDVEHGEARDVVVVNERLARTFWPGEDPLGKRLRWGLDVPENPNPWLTVVGVVVDVADGPPGTEPYVHAYEPFSQFPDPALDNIPNAFGRHVELAVRTDADPRALAAAVRAEIGRIDPQLAIESMATMDERIAGMVAPRRFSVMTLGAFAAGSLLLAALGLYGVLAFSVTERRREIAVRLALGADRATVLRMVVLRGLRLVAIGLVTGLAASYGTAHAIGALLYETERHDAVVFAAVPVVLGLVGLLACALPAYRASRVEPMAALRAD